MLRHYRLSEKMQEVTEVFELYKMDCEDDGDNGCFHIDRIQKYMDGYLDEEGVDYRKIKRANTLSYVYDVEDKATGQEEEVKLTIRFNDEGYYKNHRYYNLNFSMDLEGFIEENNISF